MIKHGKMGRPSVLPEKQKWQFVTFNLTPKEKGRFDKLKGKRTRVDFLLELLDCYEELGGRRE